MLPVALALLVARPSIDFCCTPGNDLYLAIRRTGAPVARFATPAAAIAAAGHSGTALILSHGSDAVVASMARRRIRGYVEMPAAAPLPVRRIEWERVYVSGRALGPGLAPGQILSMGRIPFVNARSFDPLLAIGRVAGFDRLAFGPPATCYSLLDAVAPNLLVAAAPISRCLSGRYEPAGSWLAVWRFILRTIGEPGIAARVSFTPAVAPTYAEDARLPASVEASAVRRAGRWFTRAHLLLASPDEPAYASADKWPDRVGPAPSPIGDGSHGILEGFSSSVGVDGGQPVRWYRRADCNAESAMALGFAGRNQVSERLADFIALRSPASQGVHADSESPAYGLVGWNDTGPGPGIFYGDDNARYILGLIGAAGADRVNRWDDAILRCILANFRTTGRYGFRGDNLVLADLQRLGWKHYHDADTVNLAPHFEAYLWACELWAHARTGYRPLLTRAEAAIARTVAAGEQAWTWTNGLQQERARMLLPLAWLVRVDDSHEHRAWLRDMVRKVLANQASCGAIREEIGDLSHGIAGPPRSNEAYGTAETPLIQHNGDPLADMLYTTNFAFLGLHEAAAATGDAGYRKAEDRLARFLCRIQIRSATHPELDGAWFRAFDFGDWDYWASNADLGWGAWSVETGWSVSWITAVLALRVRHSSLWSVHSTFHANPDLVRFFAVPGD